jgi:predicted AAA+ superfamily ATPase
MFSRQDVWQVLEEQQVLKSPAVSVDRLAEAAVLQKSPFVGVISGVRRCGKSTLLQQIRASHQEQQYYINFDDDRLISFAVEDFQALYELWIEKFGIQTTFYFDEIQNVLGWERFVRRLYDQGNKVYVTGSNATLLSKELGTRLTGRNIPLTLYPFSFVEYLRFLNIDIDKNSSSTVHKGSLKGHFQAYCEMGGFPDFIRTKETSYLRALYDNILFRDVVSRHAISSEKTLKEIALFIASNCGKPISYGAIQTYLKLGSQTTVKDYLSYMEDAYLIFLINKFSPSVKTQQIAPKKVYFIDVALARTVGFRTTEDRGPLLENLVFLELKRRGFDVSYYQGKAECDFVCRESNTAFRVIQVCADLSHPQTRERELRGLIEACEVFQLNQGLILTMDTEEIIRSAGVDIHIEPVWKWLLKSDVSTSQVF